MKKKYLSPQIDVIEIEAHGCICESDPIDSGEGNDGDF